MHPLRVNDVRVFQGRTSMGVRGINLGDGDKLISLSILRHVEANAEERAAISSAPMRAARRHRQRRGRGQRRRQRGGDRRDRARPDPLRRAVGGRAVRAHHFRERLRQTLVVVRYRTTGRGGKASSPWRSPRRTAACRLVPIEDRPDHAGHRRRPVDPLPGRRHPHRRPLDAGRHRVLDAEGERVASVERLSEEGEENGATTAVRTAAINRRCRRRPWLAYARPCARRRRRYHPPDFTRREKAVQ